MGAANYIKGYLHRAEVTEKRTARLGIDISEQELIGNKAGARPIASEGSARTRRI